jgi:hypothetical protein
MAAEIGDGALVVVLGSQHQPAIVEGERIPFDRCID